MIDCYNSIELGEGYGYGNGNGDDYGNGYGNGFGASDSFGAVCGNNFFDCGSLLRVIVPGGSAEQAMTNLLAFFGGGCD